METQQSAAPSLSILKEANYLECSGQNCNKAAGLHRYWIETRIRQTRLRPFVDIKQCEDWILNLPVNGSNLFLALVLL